MSKKSISIVIGFHYVGPWYNANHQGTFQMLSSEKDRNKMLNENISSLIFDILIFLRHF